MLNNDIRKNIFDISLVVPVYNEAEIIEETLDIYTNILSKITDDFEIVVVDDGSTDTTNEIINNISSRNNKVKIITNSKNVGSGRSIINGFKSAQNNIVVSNFADRPFDLSELPNILTLLNNNNVDFVIVTRIDRSANSFYRKTTSYVNFIIIRTLFQLKISDFQFIQCYKRNALNLINLNSIISNQTFVAPELMIRAFNKGLRACEYKSFFYPRDKGKPKYNNPLLILKAATEIIIFWYKWKFHKERCQ